MSKPAPGLTRVAAIHGAAQGDAWAVADQWVDGFWNKPTVLLRFDGRQWSRVKNVGDQELLDLVAFPTGDMWAVGESVTIHHRCA